MAMQATGNNALSLVLHTSQSPEVLQTTTIVIVTYNSAATIDACLASVIANIRSGDSVIIIDNASRDNTSEKLRRYADVSVLTLILNQENSGYAVAVNQGIRLARTAFVTLLNPDTVVTTGWSERLQNHFSSSAIAAVGPVSNFAAGRQSVSCHWKGPLPEQISPDQAAAELALTYDQGAEKTELLIGFCLMLRRELDDLPVFMDERLFLGNDDLELSWRLRLQGYELLIAKDCFVYHEGQHSFRSDPETLTGRLVQESSAALYRILAACYGADRVPSPEKLWNIDWFEVDGACWNDDVPWDQVLFQPAPWLCPDHLVSIIILTFNQWRYTEECLAAVARHTPEPYELIIVDNGSIDGTVEYLRQMADHNDRISLILNNENRGYAAGCNQGIQAARGEYLVLLNNDVVVTPEWLSGLLECHRSHAGAGVVGPMTNRASGIQVVAEAVYSLPEGLDNFSRSLRIDNRFCFVPTRRVVGFCMLLHRAVIEKIGLLDEQFGSGNYEDDDFCLRAAIEGFQNLVASDVYVHHHGSVSFAGNRIDYRSALARNAELFKAKWSRPVIDPIIGAKVEVCRLNNDIEALFLDEQISSAQVGIKAALNKFPENRLLIELSNKVTSVAAQSLESDSPAVKFVRKSLEAQAVGQHEYASALILAAFRLEPWRPEVIALILGLAANGQVGLALKSDQAFRLYPASRGLARLRVQLAALEEMSVAVEWGEEFISIFGPDDLVIESALKQRDKLGTCSRESASRETVSLCMIVKDEEKNLARCLSSCKKLVTEMVVVDTGSCDRTVKIAMLFGAKVFHYPWQSDFAAARNRSLELATGNWILIMDADEAISVRDHAVFRETLIVADSSCGYVMTTRNYTMSTSNEGFVSCRGEYPENEAGAGWTPSDKVRLFPANSGIRFVGSVHEMVEPSMQAAGLYTRHHSVPVHHYGGLDKARLAVKRKEYLAIGLKKLEESPDDPKALYELAIQAAELDRFDIAELLWRNLLNKQPEFAKGWFNLGYALLRQGKCVEACQASDQAISLEPGLSDAMVNKALCEASLLSGVAALHSAEKWLEKLPRNPVIMVLVALAFCRAGRYQEGKQLLSMLEEAGVQCKPIIDGVLNNMLSIGSDSDCEVMRQVADDLRFHTSIAQRQPATVHS